MLYEIEGVENGYIVKSNSGLKAVFPDLISVFKDMLLTFEGKSEFFLNESYAKVKINYKESNKGKIHT